MTRTPVAARPLPDLSRALGLSIGAEYQPIVDVRTGDVVAHEALSRFWRPDGTPVPPAEVFQRLHADPALLLDTELATKLLQRAHAPSGTVFLNVDPDAFAEGGPGEANAFVASLARPGRARVVVEIIENERVPDAALAREMVASLRAAELGIALDDVGAKNGLLSVECLFDVDVVKLDRSVVRRLGEAPRFAFWSAFVAATRAVGLVTILEGVETVADLERATALGVDRVQGFLFRPGFQLVRF